MKIKSLIEAVSGGMKKSFALGAMLIPFAATQIADDTLGNKQGFQQVDQRLSHGGGCGCA
jgi:hypothetical protein